MSVASVLQAKGGPFQDDEVGHTCFFTVATDVVFAMKLFSIEHTVSLLTPPLALQLRL